jgi:DNA-binding NtrC family response regulator
MNNIRAKPMLLVVDDEVDICSLLKECLEDRFVVEMAHNGTEALQKVEVFKPDIVLLDIRMPVMSGMQALKAIKLSQPDTRVIMLTAMGSTATAEECLKQGAFGYIMKPVDLDVLEDTIRSALAPEKGVTP